jgi:3-carboxy-cis,cis-muconate cycloisomerase
MKRSSSMPELDLLATLFGDEQIANVFSDQVFIQHMLEVEVALTKVQGRLGIIPSEAAQTIASTALNLDVDMARLREDTIKDGVPVAGLVRQVRKFVGEPSSIYIHWGATTQDIVDTARLLQIRQALAILDELLKVLIGNLAELANQHRSTLMAARTHSQQALPMPFGLKVASWLAPLLRHQQRLQEITQRLFVIQFGGAAGTLASLGDAGIKVQDDLAAELGLGVPLMSWHTQRDCIVELSGWLSLVSGSLAKMAQDVILMAQTEVGEIAESNDQGRGGSSSMPQKSNPVISEMIIAAARTNAALLSAMHQALIQEHERGTHGWQMEWISLPQMFTLTASALKKAVFLNRNLAINSGQMRANVNASNGLMMAEALQLALAPILGQEAAKTLVTESCQTTLREHRHLADVIRATLKQNRIDAALDWEQFKDETRYFGSSDVFINRVLEQARKV